MRPAGIEPVTFGYRKQQDFVEKCSNPLGSVDKLLFRSLQLATVLSIGLSILGLDPATEYRAFPPKIVQTTCEDLVGFGSTKQ
jgi:hypothetical protein